MQKGDPVVYYAPPPGPTARRGSTLVAHLGVVADVRVVPIEAVALSDEPSPDDVRRLEAAHVEAARLGRHFDPSAVELRPRSVPVRTRTAVDLLLHDGRAIRDARPGRRSSRTYALLADEALDAAAAAAIGGLRGRLVGLDLDELERQEAAQPGGRTEARRRHNARVAASRAQVKVAKDPGRSPAERALAALMAAGEAAPSHVEVRRLAALQAQAAKAGLPFDLEAAARAHVKRGQEEAAAARAVVILRDAGVNDRTPDEYLEVRAVLLADGEEAAQAAASEIVRRREEAARAAEEAAAALEE